MTGKILYSCLSRSWGGMEMRTISGIEQLHKRNIETELLCYPGSRIYDEADKRNFRIHTSKAPGYIHPVEILKTAKLIKQNEFKLIHTQASHDLWLLVPALNLIKSDIPLILTKRVGSFIVKKDGLHKKLYDRVNSTIAISEVIKKNLEETTPLNEDRIVLLHNGVDLEKFNPINADREKLRSEFNIKNNEIVIGMLGRFSWGKGHEEFLFAAKELIREYDNIKFLIVGEPSVGEIEYGEKIKKMSKDYELNESVIFTGFRSDTPDVLAAMDIFAFPSHSEAFGQSLVEAMAMGKPSVCSNSDGILDIAVEGETSFLFERRNAEDFRNKLKKMIDAPTEREKFGKASIQRVKEHFELEKQTDKLIHLYHELLVQ
ncbi:glycosyltransferase family 4 protein [Bacteroidota bacterium]